MARTRGFRFRENQVEAGSEARISISRRNCFAEGEMACSFSQELASGITWTCLTAAMLILGTTAPSVVGADIQLRFKEDGTFKILQVADMHYGNGITTDCSDIPANERPYCSDLNTTAFVRLLIQKEAPDLIVFSGDNICGSASDARTSMNEAFAPAIEAKIPWAAILGNHDVESNMNRPQLMAYISGMDLSLGKVQDPPVEGTYGWGNYYLQVFGPTAGKQNKATKSLLNLYFLDSGDNSKLTGIEGYDWIRSTQLNWFMNTARRLKTQANNLKVPALAYFHIPFPEYDSVLYEDHIVGVQQENVFSPPVNSGFFTTLLEDGNVKASFVGHDHINDYCGTLLGINLCYGGGTGYHAYGKVGWARRARVVMASLEMQASGDSAVIPNITTWKRLDDSQSSILDTQLLYSKSTDDFVTTRKFAFRSGCCFPWTAFVYRQGKCYFWNAVIYGGSLLVVIGTSFLSGLLAHWFKASYSRRSSYKLLKPETKVQD